MNVKTLKNVKGERNSIYKNIINDIEKTFGVNYYYSYYEKFVLEEFKEKMTFLEMKKKIIETNDYNKKKNEYHDKLLIKSIDICIKHDISVTELSVGNVIETARNIEVQKYIDKNYPNGIELEISCCSECSTWFVGDHRCSCGNRRMELIVEGDIINGFYAYPEAY
jgi:hypothetical protein